MIKKSVFENELIAGMQRELRAHDEKQGMNNLVKAAEYLHSAVEIFEEAGMTVKADQVLNILSKIAGDDQDAKKKSKVHDKHTHGLTSEKMLENLKQHGHVFNMADTAPADDLLDADIGDEPLEVNEREDSFDKTFEDEEDGKIKTAAKYGQQAAPAVTPAPAAKAPAAPASAPAPAPAATPAAAAPVAAAPAATPAEAAATAAAKKAALEAAKAAATAAKAAAGAAATAAKDAAEKLKSLETGASLRRLMSKYSDNAAPSAHVRSWDPSAKEISSNQKPTINHVEGNIGTDRKATDAEQGIGVDAPSHKATDPSPGVGVDAPSHRATDATSGKGVDARSHKATDDTPGKGVAAPSHKATDGDSSDAQTAGGTPVEDAPSPARGTSSDVRSPTSTEVRSPTSTEVRSPTSTEVRSPTSTEVRSPTSTSTEVRSPTSTSTEAYTADNFTATVTGGAGAGANTTVNIYLAPPTTSKINPNVPHTTKDKKASLKYLMDKYGSKSN